MPISLKNLVGSGQSIEIGECVMLQDQSEPIIELDDMVFLKSGNLLTDEEEEYPDAFEKFGVSIVEPWKALRISQITGNSTGTTTFSICDDTLIASTTRNGVVRAYTEGSFAVSGFAAPGSNAGRAGGINGRIFVYTGSSGGLKSSLLQQGTFGPWVSKDTPITSHSGSVFTTPQGLLLVGNNGEMAITSDGVEWNVKERVIGLTNRFFLHANNLYIVSGNTDSIYISSDLETWTSRSTVDYSSGLVMDIAWADGIYVLVGANGIIATSTDTITWTIEDSGVTSTLRSVKNVGGIWYVFGDDNVILTSTDSVVWDTHLLEGPAQNITDAIFFEGQWLLGGRTDAGIYLAPPTPAIGLQTLTQDGQSTQYMRIK